MDYRIEPVRAVWRNRPLAGPMYGRSRRLAQWGEYSMQLRIKRLSMTEEERQVIERRRAELAASIMRQEQ